MKRIFPLLLILCMMNNMIALAEGLPKDVPITYPAPEMDEEASLLELDDTAVAEGTPFERSKEEFPIAPGDKPKEHFMTIQMVSDLVFATPDSAAEAMLTNPASSNVILRYVLRISVAELERQTGYTGYTQEQWEALQAEPDFDPKTSYITLATTKGIAPGSVIQTVRLNPLPDGSIMPAGQYHAEMAGETFDPDTNEKAMVNVVVNIGLYINSDKQVLQFDTKGCGKVSAFNPANAKEDMKVVLMISQQTLMDTCGEAHRTEAELLEQELTQDFNPAYEFITLYESPAFAPGTFFERSIQLFPLPDGQILPTGEYAAWLIRYKYDEQTDTWIALDTKTRLKLAVGKAVGG